jgi:hypothetical protein
MSETPERQMSDIGRLDVSVDSAPEPGLLRPVIEAVLAGRATTPGPEQAIALAVRDAVAATPGAASEPARPATPPEAS